VDEAQRFMTLVSQHWNHVNHQLEQSEVYLPLVHEDDQGDYAGNDWAKGFLTGTHLRQEIWAELINDDKLAGAMVPIMALAHENDPNPELRPFKEPIDAKAREVLIIASAAGVMRMYAYFLRQRDLYVPKTATFVRSGRKVGRNAPCPCGSGKKFKRCCGTDQTLH
jgi:uncharacterized protein